MSGREFAESVWRVADQPPQQFGLPLENGGTLAGNLVRNVINMFQKFDLFSTKSQQPQVPARMWLRQHWRIRNLEMGFIRKKIVRPNDIYVLASNAQ